MLSISLTELSSMENCPACKTKFILKSGEYVCVDCGIVRPSFDTSTGALVYGRNPTSHFVYGDGLGTDIFSKSRGEDGSNSPSFDLHGGNGKYNPTVCVIQPWDLLNVVEPKAKMRMLREKLSAKGRERKMMEFPCSECDLTFGSKDEVWLHMADMFEKVFGLDSALADISSSVDCDDGVIDISLIRAQLGEKIRTKTSRALLGKTPPIDEVTLSNRSNSIIGFAKKLIDAQVHLIADEYTREEMDINDPIIFASPIRQDRQVRQLFEEVAIMVK